MGQHEGAQNTRPQGGLPGNTNPISKHVNAVSTWSGLQLKELEPKQVTHKAVYGDKEEYEKNL